MLTPADGPFLFDTSAESWLARSTNPAVLDWIREYLFHYQPHVSALTVMERVRGYSLLWRSAAESRREFIEAARVAYLNTPRRVWPLDEAVAVLAGEVMALIPDPPT